MDTQPIPRWLEWAREIQSLSQTGLAFARNEYEKQRYHRLAEIAAEIVHDHTNLPVEKLADNFMSQPGYATPKIDVRGAVVRENKILLVKEISDGRWSMPGGWADVGDRPSHVAEREVLEESGFHVRPVKVIGVFDANHSGRPLEFYHAFKIIF
ncbi:MAG: NUDIX domain-containing protein, partial [Calditrichaeota bacterium]|nr:NUDIX domain-containing protein [Calditrichota bacterium]